MLKAENNHFATIIGKTEPGKNHHWMLQQREIVDEE